MPQPSVQAPAAVAMVRPHRFRPNPETAADNAFQSPAGQAPEVIARLAHAEMTAAAARLQAPTSRWAAFT